MRIIYISRVLTGFRSLTLTVHIMMKELSSWVLIKIGKRPDRRLPFYSKTCISTNLLPFLGAPGADDDGSGTVTILEAYRALLASDFKPSRPLEFHWSVIQICRDCAVVLPSFIRYSAEVNV